MGKIMGKNKIKTVFAMSAMALMALSSHGGEWVKPEINPLLGGGDVGTIFDICVLKTKNGYTMYSSWRPQKSIAVHYSKDGKKWTYPKIVLPFTDSENEFRVNRPCVLVKDGVYHMWYTGQTKRPMSKGRIFYATSTNGVDFKRHPNFVMESTEQWEGITLMCPHVIWDESEKIFKMWYSGGESYEPNAIGYATSPDGINWKKHKDNPICTPRKDLNWEKDRVTACQVIKRENDYLMFYIGFEDIHTARICMARSKDGITNWERYSKNPIIEPTPGAWDGDATYKPYALFDGKKWMLWYNGRIKHLERIGVAIHAGEDLGF